MRDNDLLIEAQRQFSICNACRYCEGYCAVFPALEQKTEFAEADMEYLGSLCHDCRGCYQACMYAPPHEYAVNIPKLLSQVRSETYRRHAVPGLLAGAFARPWLAFVVAALVAAIAMVSGTALRGSPAVLATPQTGAGAFYRVIPYLAMVIPALLLSAWSIVAMLRGVMRFANEQRAVGNLAGEGSILNALWDGLALTYLRGGGGGCFYPEADTPRAGRRWAHVILVLGIFSAFIATMVAAVFQDVAGWVAPYPWVSAPVIFGSVGGVGMIIGSCGLLALKRRSAPGLAAQESGILDVAFLWQLLGVAATGMLLLFTRSTVLMGTALVVHLCFVAALFATAPYGKFVHALYRLVALTAYLRREAINGDGELR
ncbi:MAG: tricarballylate utilization 4Fe-4S protein TcuB [bacterium]|nr:tricarballylate utilization 4Fe-4S protein TcuB [bacterium]